MRSCLLQYQRCLRLIERRGWIPIPEGFDDDGWSGADSDRPALIRMIERARDGAFDQVIIDRVDRLTRSFEDWIWLGQIFRQFGVGVSVADVDRDLDSNALSSFQLNTLAIFAELEHSMIVARLRDAHAARRAHGARTSGGVPFGYLADRYTKQLVPVRDEAEVVTWMFERADEGACAADIAREANERFSGREWHARAVLRVLRNPRYAGRLKTGEPGIHAPIVAPELFDRVVATIEERRTRAPSKRTPLEHDDSFLLRGLLVCERCGSRMTTTSTSTKADPIDDRRRTKPQRRYYRCRGHGCRGTQLEAGWIETAVIQLLVSPSSSLPTVEHERLSRVGRIWEVLLPQNRRRLLLATFESVTWNSRRRSIVAILRTEIASDDPQNGSE